MASLLDILGAPRRGVVSAYKYLNPDAPSMLNAVGPGYGSTSDIMPTSPMGALAGAEANSLRPGSIQGIDQLLGPPDGTMVPSQAQGAGGGILPMLLGGAGAGLAALTGFGSLAPLAFALGTGAGQMINEGTGSVTPYDVQDVTGDLGGAGNLLANLAADPLMWAGGMSAGRSAMGRAGQAASRLDEFTTPQALIGRNATLGGQGSISAGGTYMGTPAIPSAPIGATPSLPGAAGPLLGGYDAEQLAQVLGQPIDLAAGGAATSYQRVNPQVSALLQELGMASPGGKGMQFPGGLPNWAQYRGSSVMPTPEIQGALPHMQDLAGLNGYSPDMVQRSLSRMRSLFPEGSLPPAQPMVGPTQASPELMRLYDMQKRIRGGY